ncbi:MAG: hypothetical protein EBU08_08750 [Micrococcales bacterium]|nr:hypothetical protein [Micrococcales bacterium]
MGLPSELNPSARPNRIQGTAFAGPEPDEALMRLRRRKEQEEASRPKPTPATTYISQRDANKLQQIARQEEKAAQDRFNAQTERTLDTAGVKHRQVAGGNVEPKVTSDNRGIPSLEWGAGETTNELGEKTRFDEYGNPVDKPAAPVKIMAGNKDFGEDPYALYRVPMGKPQVDGATPDRDPSRKSKRIGGIDELRGSDDEAVRRLAIEETRKRDEKLYDQTFQGLKATEDGLRAERDDLKSRIQTLKDTPPPISADATDEQRAEYAKKLAADEQALTKELNEKESQLASHKTLQAELAKQKAKESTFNALMQRGQDVRQQGIVKADGTKSNNPKDDPIYRGLQEAAVKIGLTPEGLDPEPPALPKALEGMIPSVVNGAMIGLPESEEAKGVRQQAEQAKKAIEANLENRKQKLAEFTEEFRKPAANARATWQLLRKKTDLAIAQHNELIKTGTQEEIDASSRAIDILEADLKAKLPAVIMGNQAQQSSEQLEKDTTESARKEAESRKASVDYEANKAADAVNQRKYLSGEEARPKAPEVSKDAPTDSLMEMANNKTIPTKLAVEASKEIKKATGNNRRGFAINTINQIIKGSIRFNQDQASGFYALIGRTLGSNGEFFLDAAAAARENRDWWDKTFPTDDDFNSSTAGGVIKGISELPAQMMTYIAAAPTGPIGQGAIGYLGNVSSLYAEAIADQEQAQKKTGIVLTPSQSHVAALTYALPSAGIDTISDKFTLGLGKKLALAKLPATQARNLLAKYALAASKFLWPSIKGGAVEGVTEGLQQRWLNQIAKWIAAYDPARDPNEEVARSIIIAAATGGIAVQVTAGAEKAVQFIALIHFNGGCGTFC